MFCCIYLVLLAINCIVIQTAGVTGWQYWVSLLCVLGAHICGIESGKY